MPAVNIPWPVSSMPGRRPGDGQGDLINAYAVKIGDLVEIRRTPGLVKRFTLPDPVARWARGMHSATGRLYHFWDDECRVVSPSGVQGVVTGLLPGIDRVTVAHNMRDTEVDIMVVTETAVYRIDVSSNTITPYVDANMTLHGQPNSVEYFSGYFIYTKASGYFSVSDLQQANVPNSSFGKTEYTADTLMRAKAMQNVLFLFSDKSTEAWVDVATVPMPFQRQTSLDVGLLGRWAVAGGSNEWERGLYFVAADYTVRSMEGMVPKIISNDDVAYDIYSYRDLPDAIVAQVYAFEQQAVLSISTPDWTWEYNVTSSSWHRRDSYGKPYWRATSATQHNNRWYAQDLDDARLFEIQQEVFSEDGERMRFRCESAAMKQFPASMRLPSIDIDCISALGKTRVPSPYETNPCAMISWSHDGGANWSRPVARSMGRVGQYANKITVNNLGRSTHHGTRIRVEVVDPVPATITGGLSTKVKPSRPRQVDK